MQHTIQQHCRLSRRAIRQLLLASAGRYSPWLIAEESALTSASLRLSSTRKGDDKLVGFGAESVDLHPPGCSEDVA